MLGIMVWFFILCISVPAALGQGNISLGRLEIHPGVKYEIESNSNIYMKNTNEQDDIIHKITPSLNLKYAGTTPGNYFSIGYSVDFVGYSDFDDNNYQNHNPSVEFGLESPVGFFLKVKESYISTEDPYGSAEIYYKLGTKTKRWNNTVDLTIGYKYGSYSIDAAYKNYVEGYDLVEDKWQDRQDHEYSLSLFYHLTAKTAAFFAYERTQAEYGKQNDGVPNWSSTTSQDHAKNSYYLGVRFEPGGKLSGDIKFGWGEKIWENTFDKDGYGYRDADSWIADTSVSYEATAKTSISLTLKRGHSGSPDAVAASVVDSAIMLGLKQKIGTRLSLNLGIDYANIDYQGETADNPEKAFDTFDFTLGLDYTIKTWLKTGLKYQYKTKAANNVVYQTDEYDASIISVQINATF